MQSPLSTMSLVIEPEKLPSLPHSLLKLLEIVRDPDASFTDISQIIQTDPALTSRFMAAANTAENFQLRNKNKDFKSSIVSLGLKTVKTIACNSAVQQFFSQFNIDQKDALAQFWTRALTTANLAKSLAHLTAYENEDEAYIAGLLHNIGELFCLVHDSTQFIQTNNKIIRSKKLLADKEVLRTRMEQEFIGASIPEVGAAFIEGFDQQLSDAILYQREGYEQLAGTSHMIQLINSAHKLSLLNKDSSAESSEYVFSEVSSLFDLSQSFLEEMRLTGHAEVLETAKKMGLTINDDQSVSIDESVQLELAENVRSIALSSSLQQMTGAQFKQRTEHDLLNKIIQNLNILFGLSQCLYLEFDDQAKQLKGQYGVNIEQEILDQLKIPLKAVSTLPIKSLIKQVPMTSCDVASDSSYSVVDRQLARLLNSEEILCIPLLEKIDNSLERQDSDIYGVLITGFHTAQKHKILREKGLLYEFSISSSEVISGDRSTAKQIHSVVEEEKALQAVQIRKLVHEANNPLGVIRNYLQVLALKLKDSEDEKIPGQIDILMQEVERVGSIVLRIRETPQKNIHTDKLVNINELIESLGSIFKESLFLKAGIDVQFELDNNIPDIETNTNSVKQILTNLFKNAAEALVDGGQVRVTTRDQVNYNGQQYVELCVADNGPGIPQAVLNNLFKPVKSTKSGEHSGLGLSIIKNLVNDLRGTISGRNINSKQGSKGAEFMILLPRNSPKQEQENV